MTGVSTGKKRVGDPARIPENRKSGCGDIRCGGRNGPRHDHRGRWSISSRGPPRPGERRPHTDFGRLSPKTTMGMLDGKMGPMVEEAAVMATLKSASSPSSSWPSTPPGPGRPRRPQPRRTCRRRSGWPRCWRVPDRRARSRPEAGEVRRAGRDAGVFLISSAARMNGGWPGRNPSLRTESAGPAWGLHSAADLVEIGQQAGHAQRIARQGCPV